MQGGKGLPQAQTGGNDTQGLRALTDQGTVFGSKSLGIELRRLLTQAFGNTLADFETIHGMKVLS
jgi:hypothetical protein